MARPLPVNLLLAAAGGVLLTSGLSNESLGETLQGNFGKLDSQKNASNTGGEGAVTGATDTEGVGGSEVGTTPSPSTFAPSPTTFSKKAPSRAFEAKSIAAILHSEGITNPTNAEIVAARNLYHTQ